MSVSTLAIGSGAATPVRRTNFSIISSLRHEFADIGEMAVDGSRGGHRRTDEVRAPAITLAAFEVAVRGRGAALAGLQAVVVHGETHRAARLAPFEAGLAEDAVEPFLLGLPLDQA